MNAKRSLRRLFPKAGMVIACSLTFALPLQGMTPAAAQKASELYQKHDWSGLASLAIPLTRSDPKDGWAWYYLGLAEDGLGRKDQAAAAYENCLGLVPQYLQGSVAQLLAQDYAALRQPDKLQALYQQMQKSHPDIAQSLQSQYRDVLGSGSVASGPPPEISPRTLATVTATARRSWRRDAIPVMVDVRDITRGFQVVFDFYSPSTRSGFQIVQALGGTSTNQVASPNWGRSAIPDNFLPLETAVARAAAEGVPGKLDHAFLYRNGGGGAEAVDLSWDLAMQSNLLRGISIAAYVMTKDRFDRLYGQAQNGDARAQVTLARVYLLGLTGSTNASQAFHWCTRAAARGDVDGENLLGQMYEFGRGTQRNDGLAVHWYQKAANAGFAPAEYNLGLMYEAGRGVARNYTVAQQWIYKAAHQGLGEAISELPYATAMAKGEQREAQAATAQRPAHCWAFQYYNTATHECEISATKMALAH